MSWDQPQTLHLRFEEGIYFLQRVGWTPPPGIHIGGERIQCVLNNANQQTVFKALFSSCNIGYILPRLAPRTISLPGGEYKLGGILNTLMKLDASRPNEKLVRLIQGGNIIIQIRSNDAKYPL